MSHNLPDGLTPAGLDQALGYSRRCPDCGAWTDTESLNEDGECPGCVKYGPKPDRSERDD